MVSSSAGLAVVATRGIFEGDGDAIVPAGIFGQCDWRAVFDF